MVKRKVVWVGKGDVVVEIEIAATGEKWRNVRDNFVEILESLNRRDDVITYSVTTREAKDGELLGPEFYHPKGAKKKA